MTANQSPAYEHEDDRGEPCACDTCRRNLTSTEAVWICLGLAIAGTFGAGLIAQAGKLFGWW